MAPEVESLLVLKNNRGVEGNRVRHMDYGVQINKLMYTRLLKGEEITLFSPSDVRACTTRSSPIRTNSSVCTPNTKRRQHPQAAREGGGPVLLMMQERASTGRIYIQNVDHCNTHSPFDPVVAPVRQSNLCRRSPCLPNRWKT